MQKRYLRVFETPKSLHATSLLKQGISLDFGSVQDTKNYDNVKKLDFLNIQKSQTKTQGLFDLILGCIQDAKFNKSILMTIRNSNIKRIPEASVGGS